MLHNGSLTVKHDTDSFVLPFSLYRDLIVCGRVEPRLILMLSPVFTSKSPTPIPVSQLYPSIHYTQSSSFNSFRLRTFSFPSGMTTPMGFVKSKTVLFLSNGFFLMLFLHDLVRINVIVVINMWLNYSIPPEVHRVVRNLLREKRLLIKDEGSVFVISGRQLIFFLFWFKVSYTKFYQLE